MVEAVDPNFSALAARLNRVEQRLVQEVEKVRSLTDEMRDQHQSFECFARQRLEISCREANRKKVVVRGMPHVPGETSKDLKTRLMRVLPDGFCISTVQRMGASGVLVVELVAADDKHRLYAHQSTPAMKQARVFFEDYLTHQQQCNRHVLSGAYARLRREGLKPFFREDTLVWVDGSGRRHTQVGAGPHVQPPRGRGPEQGRTPSAGAQGGRMPPPPPPSVARAGAGSGGTTAQPGRGMQGGRGRGQSSGRSSVARQADRAAVAAQDAAATKNADDARREESRRATESSRKEELRAQERALREREETLESREREAAQQSQRIAATVAAVAVPTATASAVADAATVVSAAGGGNDGEAPSGGASVVLAAGDGDVGDARRPQKRSAFGRMAVALTSAVRGAVATVSEGGAAPAVSESEAGPLRSAAQVLGSPSWRDKEHSAAERPSRLLVEGSPGAEPPAKQLARSGMRTRRTAARELFSVEGPQPQRLPGPPPSAPPLPAIPGSALSSPLASASAQSPGMPSSCMSPPGGSALGRAGTPAPMEVESQE